MAVRALVTLLLPLASVMEILAESKRDAAPSFVGEVVIRTPVNAAALVIEAAAGHTVTGRVGFQATTKTLIVAALVILGAGSMFALNWAHCRSEKKSQGQLMKQRCDKINKK